MMKWSWKLGRLWGVDVYVHATFGLLMAFVLLSRGMAGGGLAAGVSGLLFLTLLFTSVLFHEFGHSLAARRYGIRTRHITLLPIGGVAELERMPEKPRQELVVALAGPAVNVAIAAVLAAGALLGGGLTTDGLVGRLLTANVFLVLFNLLPAFPMDGGRVLRALLASRIDYVRATKYAAVTGQAMAALFGVVGLFGNPLLLFVALFVWLGASHESRAVEWRHSLRGVPVERAMLTDFRTLAPGDPLSRAADLIVRSSQREFPVEDEGRVVGMLTLAELAGGLGSSGSAARVADFMRRTDATVETGEMIDDVLERLHGTELPAVAVTRRGRIVGLVTPENVAEFMSLRRALA
jgi:Zn-dependent protease/predicted transcriptional regulator